MRRLHRVTGVACLALAIWPAAPARAQTADVLTLGQAVRLALATHARVANERDGLEQATLFRHLAGSLFRPKVIPNVQGSLGQTEASAQVYRLDLLQRSTIGTEVRAGFGASSAQIPSLDRPGDSVRFYNADSSLTVVQPLLKGWGRGVARRPLTSAEARYEDARAALYRAEQLLSLDVAAAYFRVLEQQALRDVSAKAAERSQQLVQVATAKLQAGLVSQLDVLRARHLLAEATLQFEDSRVAVETARDDLASLVGIDHPAFDVAADVPLPRQAPTVDQALRTAREARRDLARAHEAIVEADRGIAYFRNQLLPQVDLGVGVSRRETAPSLARSLGAGQFKFGTFIAVSMPIDHTPQTVDYQNAIIERDRRRRDAELLEQAIMLDVKRSVRAVQRLAASVDAAAASVALAQEEVEVATFRYARGLSSSLDVTTAEAARLAAEGRLVSARTEAAMASLRLRATLGVLDPARDFDAATGAAGATAATETMR